jgi:hypothetical protein
MNPMDHDLNRLLSAAARASTPAPKTVPASLQHRVLAGRGSRRETLDEWLAILPMVRRGLVWACAVALVAVAIGFLELDIPSSEEAIWLSSALTLDTLP